MAYHSRWSQVSSPALVLVIDDDADIHELVDVRLRQGLEPVEVLHALDAETGLRLAIERSPDAILLDLDLRGRSGLELCRALQDHPQSRSTAILFLTGTVDVATKLKAFEAGASDYVTKPFDAFELRARVQAALRMTRYRFHLERATRQRETLLALSGATETSWTDGLRTILREDSTTLEVQRTSFWRLIDGGQAIECEALYRADISSYESGLVLRATDYPRYFQALHTTAPIVASDAMLHPDTSEFSDRYLVPTGIRSMMDVPVFVRGKLVGVLCHEHVGGVRMWAVDEQQFAVSIGHMLSLAIESQDRRRAEEALRVSEARFRAIAQVSPVPMLVNSVTGRTLWSNTALSRLSGISETEITGKQAPDFYVDPDERQSVLDELHAKSFIESREVRLRRSNGEEYCAMLSAKALVFDGEPAVLVGLVDLTEQKRMEDVLRHTALHDALTGLPNRVMLFDMLRRELGRAERDTHYRFALLYFDLDGFKAINDAFGHDVGDRLLVSVATRVTECLRPMDVAARVGGDEFVVVVANISDPAEIDGVVTRIASVIVAPHRIDEHECRIGVSVGVTLSDPALADPSAMLRAADAAMYERKRERSRRLPLL